MECRSTIEQWQQTIAALSDEKFFDIMHLYLGEIKTPYYKQKLISQLAGFIRNEENLQNMINLLDEFDIKLLTAIAFIPNATYSTITEFFAGEYTMAEVYAAISNLIARLFLFIEKEEYGTREFLRINPLTWNKLEPYINISNILSVEPLVSYSMDDIFSISPNFIAAFISYINHTGCSCKADGVLKKNDANRLEEIFPGKLKILQLLITAFQNLSLVKEGEKSFEIDTERFELFASLSFEKQAALLCAASCSRFSREGLKKEAQLMLDCVSSIPEDGYTRNGMIRLAFLVGSYSDNGTAAPGSSRFSKILQAARQEKSDFTTDQAGTLIDRMIDSAIEMGLLQKKGILDGGEAVYIKGQIFQNAFDFNDSEPQKPLNIDSTFTVTLMPGLSLKNLLPLTQILTVKRNGVVSEFEITRQSISNALDKGWNPDRIFEELTKYTYYDLPQNLKISISDWYNSYSSAILYQGYVLKVTDSNIAFIENNPKIKNYIKEKLADGIYLLNVPVTDTGLISRFIEESGLNFMGKIKNPSVMGEKLPFPVLQHGKTVLLGDKKEKTEIKFNEAGEMLTKLKNKLETMDIDKNQKESLLYRIRQRLIISEEHIQKTSIRIEILEADGMDYSGKVHLIEAALKDKDVLEIKMPGYSVAGTALKDNYVTLIGSPLGITKQPGESILRFEVKPEGNIENILVSRITHLRRLKF